MNRPIRFERNWLNKESNASSRNLLVEISSQRPNRSRRLESLTRVRKKNSQDKVKLASLPRETSSWYSSRDPLPRTNLARLKISHGIHSTAMCAPMINRDDAVVLEYCTRDCDTQNTEAEGDNSDESSLI